MTTNEHPSLRLFSGPLSMFGMKAQIAAIEKGLDFELVMVPFETAYEPKHPEVVRINPKRQVPVLVHGDLELFDSTQIFEYFEDLAPDPPLWPRDRNARARARQLELKSDEIYFPHIIRLMGLQDKRDDPAFASACVAASGYYEDMNKLLADREYLAGSYSFADIAFYMAQVFGARMGAPIDSRTPHLVGWRDRVTARPAVEAVLRPMMAFLAARGRHIPDFLRHLAPPSAG